MTRIRLPDASFSFLTQGAIIQEFTVAGHNLILSFTSAEPYLEAPYFGETIGRVANRIEGGLIHNLNGRSYQLATNQAGRHHLHGGDDGWGRKEFSQPRQVFRNGRETVHLTYLSPDGEEGYPGTVELRVWYTPYSENGKVTLEIEYEAELVSEDCDETVVNVTNHRYDSMLYRIAEGDTCNSYFSLNDAPTIEGTEIRLATSDVLEIDDHAIPTGQIIQFAGIGPNEKLVLGSTEPKIDHCFVMDKDPQDFVLDTRARQLRRMASARHPSSNICLEIFSTEPSFQFYTGDYVDVPATSDQTAQEARAGFCIEPCRFVNAINVAEWRNQVALPRGHVWGSRIVYQAWEA